MATAYKCDTLKMAVGVWLLKTELIEGKERDK